MSVTSTEVVIYTDGACKGNPGRGGWGAWLKYGEQEKELWGGEALTTNNRMELTAPIEALASLTRRCNVVLYTDSEYVRNGISTWIHGWKQRGWKTADKKPVKNIDLWQRLDHLGCGRQSIGRSCSSVAAGNPDFEMTSHPMEITTFLV